MGSCPRRGIRNAPEHPEPALVSAGRPVRRPTQTFNNLSIRRRARRSLRFAALRLIPRIAAASATLCRWMSQRRNTSRQLRRNCKACISTACITPDGILGCSVDERSRRPFTWSGSVIVKVDVGLDIPVTGYPASWRKIDDMQFCYGRGKASRLTPKPSRTAPAKLKNDASPPGGNRPPSGCW